MKRFNRFKNKKHLMLLLIFCISIGFATLAANLAINGTARFSGGTWNVHLDNVQVLSGSVAADVPTLNANEDTVDFSVILDAPGDYFSFTVDAVNEGSIDAMVKSIENTVLQNDTAISLPAYAEYTVTYEDGTAIAQNHLLESGATITYKVTVKYKENYDPLTMDSEGEGVYFRLAVNFGRATSAAVSTNSYVCKRATTLHTAECTSTYDGCYQAGYTEEGEKGTTTITYGNLGTAGQNPVVGDAYDCDVNNDGTYDSVNERFYYISDSGSNEGYASLVYSNAFTNASYDDSSQNYNGPVSLLDVLPSKTTWNNSGLNTDIKRQILNEVGGTSVSYSGTHNLPEFTYTNRAARLITLQEVQNACGIAGEDFRMARLYGCEFLHENLGFDTGNTSGDSSDCSWWLETPDEYSGVIDINSSSADFSDWSPNMSFRVRPVIEVESSKIEH